MELGTPICKHDKNWNICVDCRPGLKLSPITKTIKESLEQIDEMWDKKSLGNCEHGADTIGVEQAKSHLLQSQIRLIDVQIANLKKEYKKAFEAYQFSEATREFFRGKLDALEDQISSLEEVKKSIENL